ncbi:MAG: transglycosylase SLT domain-containing protein [Truepera sp.]|nr:transglycosylase SLT domain-containing protein [Truepera sp.]MBS3968021.1 transglycosylase SLT domain-containing protein [Truepera sp.]
MSLPRLILSVSLALAVLAWLFIQSPLSPPARGIAIPIPTVYAVVSDPYQRDPLLHRYGLYRTALLANDLAALQALLEEVAGSYLEYRTLLTLARSPQLPAGERYAYFERAMAVRINDPLARLATRELLLEQARLAEEAGLVSAAIDHYAAALPAAAAFTALRRLETRPLVLANIFLRARQHRNALSALDGWSAPSIEAPAYRAIGEHARALDAYQRWLNEEPSNATALFGRAWSLFALGRNAEAERAFSELSGPSALHGLALLANRAGDLDHAVTLLRQSGEPRHLWLATDLLEGRGRSRDALPIYLDLAVGGSAFADDAAHRALVLAERLGQAKIADQALDLLPEHSFFGALRGKSIKPALVDTLTTPELEVVALARALMRVGDHEAAVGELLFALRKAADEASIVALGETLQTLGEYRQSARAARQWQPRSLERRTWQLAYPRAYAALVEREAAAWQVEPALIWAVMRQESAFYPRAISVADAQGLMQVIPSTWTWLAEMLREAPGDPFDTATNIRYGVYYLRRLIDRFDGDLELVVAAYNRGQGYISRLYQGEVVNGDRNELYRFIDAFETREYLQIVMHNYQVYRLLYFDTALAQEQP